MGVAAQFYRVIAMYIAERMRATVGRLGNGKDADNDVDENKAVNPIVSYNLEIAKAKFNWLMAKANY